MLTLIEARPSAGETTAMQRLAELLLERDRTLAGFVTEEIREAGRRMGFSIKRSVASRARSRTRSFQDLPASEGTEPKSASSSGSRFQRWAGGAEGRSLA